MVQLNTLEAIILDMDGTILDTTAELCHAVATAVNRMIPHLNLHHSQVLSDYPNLYGGPLEEFHDTIVLPHRKSDLSDAEHGASTSEFVRYFLEEVERAPPCPAFADVCGALAGLRRKYPSVLLAVATTKPTRVAEKDLAVSPSLRPLLTHVQGTDAGMAPKPAPDVLLRCAAALGVDVRQTIYVGDTSRDATAARAAGCRMTLTVRRDGGKNPDTLGADALIPDFDGIEGAVRSWGEKE